MTVRIGLTDLTPVCLHSLLLLKFDGFFRLHVILSGKSNIAYVSTVYLRGIREGQSWSYLVGSEVTEDACLRSRRGPEALSNPTCLFLWNLRTRSDPRRKIIYPERG